MKIRRFSLLGALICLSCSSPADNPESPISYERTTIFETSPGEAPYGFLPQCRPSHTIQFELGLDQDFQALNDSLNIELTYAPSIGYFWALNDGNLVFLNRILRTIFILNPVAGHYYTFCPVIEPHTLPDQLWVGANDEIFVLLAKFDELRPDSLTVSGPKIPTDSTSPDDKHRIVFRLLKYRPLSEGCILDTAFDMAEFDEPPRFIRISPQNRLYIQTWRIGPIWPDPTKVFDEDGRFIKNTRAHGETSDGREFYTHSWPRDNLIASLLDWITGNRAAEIIAWPDRTTLLRIDLDRAHRNTNFKATFDGRLLMYLHNGKRLELPDGGKLVADFPIVAITDLANGDFVKIDLSECRREEYDYFSISDVSLNYLGEIYAIAIYFNDKDGQSSDEKIVLYRWRQKNP